MKNASDAKQLTSLLKTTQNTRELGGCRTLNGTLTKMESILRSDIQNYPCEEDFAYLKSKGITTIIDLRGQKDVERKPSGFAGRNDFTYYNFQIDEGSGVPESPEAVPLSYMDIAKAGAMSEVFKCIANAKSGVMINCTAGKDRTGVVSAILLLHAAVVDEDIIENYVLTKEYGKERLALVHQNFPEIDMNIVTPCEWFMKEFLRLFRAEFGDVTQYFKQIGLNDEEIQLIRNKLCEKRMSAMQNMNDATVVKQQYQNADKLSIRISLHEKYSTNKEPFGDWIVSNYEIKPNSRVLELGCGTGDMWRNHLNLIDNGTQLILSDFSEGMLKTTQDNLGEHANVTYRVIDIQDIPYNDNTFDVVIANMMLYHVPDLQKGLSEVARVLKEDGTFYCATFGENGHTQYIERLLKDYGVKDTTDKPFTLQNGAENLQKHFKQITRLERQDGLAITDLDDIMDYIYSCTRMTNVTDVDRDVLKDILSRQMVDGVLHMPKEYGMFICRK